MLVAYLWLQSLDAVVGHQEDLQWPQPHEGSAVDVSQLVPAQVQQPGAVRDAEGDVDETSRPTVHQVRGLVAQTASGAKLEAQNSV